MPISLEKAEKCKDNAFKNSIRDWREHFMDKRTFEEKFCMIGYDAKSFEIQKQNYEQIRAQFEPSVQKVFDEEINLFIQAATIVPKILENDKLYDYLDMVTNNFVIENMERFLMIRIHIPERAFDKIKSTVSAKEKITQLFLPYIRNKNEKRTGYEREIDILIDLFSEAIEANEQIISIIVLYFILIHFIEQFSIKWVNMYPQFGDITSKADALQSYAQVYCDGDKDVRKNLSNFGRFSFSCWLFYESIDNRKLPDIVESIYTETQQAIKETEIAKTRSTLLQPKNDVIMQRTPIGDSKEPITISKIDNYSGTEFEAFIGSLFEADGYQVEFTQASNDKGIDIIAKRSGVSIGIQCKRYSSSIGISAVQEVFSGKNYYSLDKALVVTNNTFTKAAKELADSTGVVLWDRNILIAKISLL